jgi:hypothetical protein
MATRLSLSHSPPGQAESGPEGRGARGAKGKTALAIKSQPRFAIWTYCTVSWLHLQLAFFTFFVHCPYAIKSSHKNSFSTAKESIWRITTSAQLLQTEQQSSQPEQNREGMPAAAAAAAARRQPESVQPGGSGGRNRAADKVQATNGNRRKMERAAAGAGMAD